MARSDDGEQWIDLALSKDLKMRVGLVQQEYGFARIVLADKNDRLPELDVGFGEALEVPDS